MKKLMKKFIIAFLGLLQGTFGSYWGLLGIAFTFPESGPGSRDYEEEQFFVPFGVIMLLSLLTEIIFIYYKLRKKKSDIITFSVAQTIGIAIFIFYILYWD